MTEAMLARSRLWTTRTNAVPRVGCEKFTVVFYGGRITETATRIRIASATARPEARLCRGVAAGNILSIRQFGDLLDGQGLAVIDHGANQQTDEVPVRLTRCPLAR